MFVKLSRVNGVDTFSFIVHPFGCHPLTLSMCTLSPPSSYSGGFIKTNLRIALDSHLGLVGVCIPKGQSNLANFTHDEVLIHKWEECNSYNMELRVEFENS